MERLLKTRETNFYKHLILPFFLLVPFSSYAESLGSVVVTADKQEVLEEKTGASVTIISRQEIEGSGAISVPDALRKIPSLNVSSPGSPGDDSDIRMRGADRDEVLVLVDGVPINNVAENRAIFLGGIPVDQVEKIEIVHGAQSIFYGSDAVGGVINIITKKASGKPQFFLNAGAGNLQNFKESTGFSAGSDKIRFNLTAFRQDQRGRFDRDRYGEIDLSGNFAYQLHPDITFEMGGNYARTHQDLFYEFLSSFDPGTSSILVTIDPDNNRSINRDFGFGHIALKAKPPIGNDIWSFEGIYSVFMDRAHTVNLATGDTAPAGLTPGTQDFDGTGSRHQFDFRHFLALYSSPLFSLDFTAGIELETEKFEYTDPPTVFPAPGQKADRQNYAPYFQATNSFLEDSLIVSAGARFDKNTTFGHEWSPRASILYKILKSNTIIRGSYGEGFHAPTILDFYTAVLQQSLGMPFQPAKLQSELSQNYEIGVEQKMEDWASIRATFFYTDFDRLFDGLQFIQDAYATGIESGIDCQPLKRIRLGANYTFLTAVNEDLNIRLPDRPRHQWHVFAEYGILPQLNLRTDLSIIGGRLIPNTISTGGGDFNVIFIDTSGTPEGGSLAAAQTEAGRTLGGYTKLDLALQYDLPHPSPLSEWKIFGKVENLLNRHYQEKFGFPAPGITFFAGSQAKF